MVIRYSKLTPDLKQQIIDLFESGKECRSIPGILGVSERAVARVLVEAGINTKRRNRYTLDEGYFDCVDSVVKAYLLGLIAADGCVTTKNYVAFESIDPELTALLKMQLQYSGNTRVIFPKGGQAPHYRINFSSKRLALALSEKGVIAGRGSSGTYYFPENQYLASYILGYFDGDGCAYLNKGRSGGSVDIVGSLEFVTQLAKTLKMGAIRPHQSKPVAYWKIYSRINIQSFYDFIYQYQSCELGLQRKRQKIEAILRSYQRG